MITGCTATADWTLVVPVLILTAPLVFFAWWIRSRNLRLRRLARRLGLTYQGRSLFATWMRKDDPLTVATGSLELLPAMVRQRVTALLDGTWRGRSVTFFQAGAISGISVDLPADCPRLVIDGRRGVDKFWGAGAAPVSLAEHRGTEWEEFERAFDVRCDDPRFASAFVDQRMMRALMDFADDHLYIEIRGDTLMLARTRSVPAPEVEAFLDRVTTLADHIPRVIPELYRRTSEGPTDGPSD